MESRRSYGWGMTGSDKRVLNGNWKMNTEKCRVDMYTKQPMKLSGNVENSVKNLSAGEKVRAQRFGRFLPPQGDLNIRGEQ